MKRQSFMLTAGAALAGCAAPAMSPGLLTTSGAQRTLLGPDDNSEGQLLGSLFLSPYDFVPQHFEACQGQLIPIRSNLPLFTLLGVKFGGDGKENFGLPDLRKHAPLKGLSYLIATKGMYPGRKPIGPNFGRTEQLLGQIVIVPYLAMYVPPPDWAVCDGQLLNIGHHIALYSLLGAKFGGDGMNTFALPDLRKREPIKDLTYIIALTGRFPQAT